MKKTFRKITASITAALLCALPLANALTAGAVAKSDARYTYRKVFAVSSAKNIDRLVIGLSCKTTNTDAPTASQLASGILQNTGGGAPGVYAGGANFYPSNHNVVGGLVSFHTHCNSPSDYKEISVTNLAYDPNGKLITNAVSASPTFLVGDINLDKKVNEADYQILHAGINKYAPNSSRYKFSYFGYLNVSVGNVSKNYSGYALDINNDGYLSKADDAMFIDYLEGDIKRFAE